MHEETIKQWDRDNAGEPQIAPEGIECPKHVAIVGLGLIGARWHAVCVSPAAM